MKYDVILGYFSTKFFYSGLMLGQHLHILLHLVIKRVQKCSSIVLPIKVKSGDDGEGGEFLGSEVRIKCLDWLEVDDHFLTEEGAFATPQ